jgi:hypothetical protein
VNFRKKSPLLIGVSTHLVSSRQLSVLFNVLPFMPHSSSIHPPFILHSSSIHPHSSSIHPPFILHSSSTHPPFILHSSSIHPPFILHSSSIHPPLILHSSSIHPPFTSIHLLPSSLLLFFSSSSPIKIGSHATHTHRLKLFKLRGALLEPVAVQKFYQASPSPDRCRISAAETLKTLIGKSGRIGSYLSFFLVSSSIHP